MDQQQFIAHIEWKLNHRFNPTVLAVKDRSHLHKNHAEAQQNKGVHLLVVIASGAFDTLGSFQRHKLVYETLADELKQGIHALTLKLYTPKEWQNQDDVLVKAVVPQPELSPLSPPAPPSFATPQKTIGHAEESAKQNPKPVLSLAQVEAAYIQQVLNHTGGHLGETCDILKLTRPRLSRLIEKYKLQVPQKHHVAFDLSKHAEPGL